MTRTRDSRRRRPTPRWLPVLCLIALAAVGLWTVIDQQPPQPVSADAPPQEFSAERAMSHVEALGRHPRPMGAPEHAGARDYLIGELEALGAQVEVHEATGISPSAGAVQATGRVHNIVATFAGTDPTGTLLLTSHYDSVPTSPGANDAAAGVAVTLEAARALAAAEEPARNDVVVLLTDGEEPGLLGAEAFTDSHPLAGAGGVVLNHEARGGDGPAVMFRASGGPGLVHTLGSVAPAPVADSAMTDAFELLPNDTDFVVFAAAGFTGMDFAYADDSVYYHSVLDTPANVSARSVQHMGANTLAVVGELAGSDLQTADDGAPVAYANVPPGLLLITPHLVLQVLAVAGLGVTVAALWRARARGLTSLPRVGLGLAAALVMVVAAVAGAWAYWQVLTVARPGFAEFITQTPYRPAWFQAGMLLGVLALGLVWFAGLRRVLGAQALSLGAVVLVVLLGAASAVASPGASLGFVLPGLAAALAVLFTPVRPASWHLGLTAGLLVPTAVLVLGPAWLTFTIGLGMSPIVVAPLAALGFLLVLPLVQALRPAGRTLVVAGLAVVVAVVAVSAVGVLRNSPGADQPAPVDLTYTLDADTGRAQWAVPVHPLGGGEEPGHPWLRALVDGEGADPTPGRPWPQPRAYVGAAEPADLEPPQVELLSEAADGEGRVLQLQVTSPRGAAAVNLTLSGPVRGVVLEGRDLPDPDAQIEFHGLRAGESLTVEVHTAGDGPVGLQVADIDETLDAVAGLPGYTDHPPEIFLQDVRVSVTTTQEF